MLVIQLVVFSEFCINRSIVFRCAALLRRCNISIVLWMELNECVCSMRCLAKLEV